MSHRPPLRVTMLLSNPFAPDPRVLAEARALVEGGYTVTIIAWDRGGRYPETEDVEGIQVRRVSVPAAFGQGARQFVPMVRFWRQALTVLRQVKSDCIHCHDLDTVLPGWLAARSQRVTLIYDAHECYPAMFAVHGGRLAPRLLEILDRWLSRRVDAVITVGEILASRFRTMTGKPVVVIGNWKDAQDYQVAPQRLATLADRLGIGGRLVISYIGAVNEDRLLQPLIQAVRNRDGVFLVLGGSGTESDRVTSWMAGMDNGVYLGWVAPAEIPPYIALSDVVYYGLDAGCPNNRFSAPNALFTALAAGRAVLTTDVGEVAQIVQEHQCGLVLSQPSAGAIGEALALFGDRAFLRLCQENARTAGQARYSWEHGRRTLLGLYDDLLGRAEARRLRGADTTRTTRP